jgi:hypothetical protein
MTPVTLTNAYLRIPHVRDFARNIEIWFLLILLLKSGEMENACVASTKKRT